jgi:2-dehydropantoate 2-reductase
MRPLLGPDTAVVTAQNGVPWWYFHGIDGPHAGLRLQSVDPGDRQLDAIGPKRAIGCVVFAAAERAAPGVVSVSNAGWFTLGEPDGQPTARLSALAEAFAAGGLTARIHPNIREEIWLKLWGNLCLNPISALTRATLDVVATDPASREVCRNMMSEAEEIAGRLGVTFPVGIEARLDRAASLGRHRTSMLQDLLGGRTFELDALLGAVQEIARVVGVSTPTIDTVFALASQMGTVAGVYPAFPPDAVTADPRS